MRTLPPTLSNITVPNVLPLQNMQNMLPHRTSEMPPTTNTMLQEQGKEMEQMNMDTDIRNSNSSMLLESRPQDCDIRLQPPTDPRLLTTKDVDSRFSSIYEDTIKEEPETEDESMLQIDTGEEPTPKDMLPDLPKTQRDLFMRIQAQQKENVPEDVKGGFEIDENINWYSDDDDDDENKLTIKDENEDVRDTEDTEQM